MQDSSLEPAVSDATANVSASGCPLQHARPLQLNDTLIFPNHKRVVLHYAENEDGEPVLYLHHRKQDVIINDPELFAFGEQLAKTARFEARTALQWANADDWPRIREILEHLVARGILQHGQDAVLPEQRQVVGPVPSPLPAAVATRSRTWLECEDITRELGGRAIELGYLEIVLPLYRVAHPALDGEGRQVGESNVFPIALRLDIATEWRGCQYAGSRYNDEFPMNVTALKAMIKHWRPMLEVLSQLRSQYAARTGMSEPMTIGDLQRLSSLALGISGYLMMRVEDRVENAALHPVWSSIFRICDGVRLTMHEMMFANLEGKPRAATTPIRAAEIYPYAEQKQLLLSDHGVCAGPKAMFEEFMNVFVDGQHEEDSTEPAFDTTLRADLACLPRALDYGLASMQLYAVVNSLWPLVSVCHQRLQRLLEAEVLPETNQLGVLRARLQREWPAFLAGLLNDESICHGRWLVHADMYAACARGVGDAQADLFQRLADADTTARAPVAQHLLELLARLQPQPPAAALAAAIAELLAEQLCREQSLVRLAAELQARVNDVLGRKQPVRPLTAADLAYHYRLRVINAQPYLADALCETLGWSISVDSQAIAVREALPSA